MCRSNELGGRRCPLHSNPTYIANRNERRRAAYANNKGSKVRNYNRRQAVSLPIEKDYSFTAEWSASQSTHFKNMNAVLEQPNGDHKFSSLVRKSDQEVEFDEKLGLFSTPLEGYLPDNDLIAAQEVSGKINYSNLDNQSYKKFGFTDGKLTSHPLYYNRQPEIAQAYADADSLTETESETISFFANDAGCEFINKPLYDFDKIETLSDPISPFENTPVSYRNLFYEEDREEVVEFKPYDYESRADLEPNRLKLTRSVWASSVNNLDSALAKSRGLQRIVHRGLSKSAAKAFEAKVGKVSDLKLGQEMVFDGFQSTSLNPQEARNRSDDADTGGRIAFEILTPEGIQISNSSPYPMESEVVLPRDARYMLVGKHVHPNRFGKMTQILQLVAVNHEGELLTSSNRADTSAVVR